MSPREEARFDEVTARSTAALGIEGALDPLLDPKGAARALARGARVVLRVAPELGPSREGSAPEPRSPAWLRVEDGGARLAEAGATTWSPLTPTKVVVDVANSPCCDAPTCTNARDVVSTWLVADDRRWLVADERAIAGGAPPRSSIGAALAARVGVPVEGPSDEAGEGEAPAPLPPSELARFTLAPEGPRLVLRDHAALGPRATASRNVVVGLAFVAAAIALWARFAQSFGAATNSTLLGLAAFATIASLAGWAFLSVARYSAQYKAASVPCVALAPGRIILAPWVTRAGAVELRLDGRFGAAIALGEVRGVSVKARDGAFAVEADTEHGPIDAMSTSHERVATFWAAALEQAIDKARHPGQKASAKQRLRQRAAAPA